MKLCHVIGVTYPCQDVQSRQIENLRLASFNMEILDWTCTQKFLSIALDDLPKESRNSNDSLRKLDPPPQELWDALAKIQRSEVGCL